MDQFGVKLEVTILVCVFVSVIVMVQCGANLKATTMVSVWVFLCFFVMDKYGTNPDDTELLCVFVCLFVIDQCGANLKIITLVYVFASVNEMVQYVANLEATVPVYVCMCVYLCLQLFNMVPTWMLQHCFVFYLCERL